MSSAAAAPGSASIETAEIGLAYLTVMTVVITDFVTFLTFRSLKQLTLAVVLTTIGY